MYQTFLYWIFMFQIEHILDFRRAVSKKTGWELLYISIYQFSILTLVFGQTFCIRRYWKIPSLTLIMVVVPLFCDWLLLLQPLLWGYDPKHFILILKLLHLSGECHQVVMYDTLSSPWSLSSSQATKDIIMHHSTLQHSSEKQFKRWNFFSSFLNSK